MNTEAQKIINDGIAKLRGLTESEAHKIVELVRRERERLAKDAVLDEYRGHSYRPIPVIEFRASYPDGEVCPPASMHYSGRVQWALDTGHSPVTVLIPQGEDKRRVLAILKQHVKGIEAFPDDEWAERNESSPTWPPVISESYDDDVPF